MRGETRGGKEKCTNKYLYTQTITNLVISTEVEMHECPTE